MLVLSNSLRPSGVPVAVAALRTGATALHGVEQGLRGVEADPGEKLVGLGGAPNLLGEMECDAALMNGADLHAGSVGALKGYLHPISVARLVMEHLPHVILVGDGAARFAGEKGAESADLLTDEARADYDAWFKEHVPADVRGAWPDTSLTKYTWPTANPVQAKGTAIFLAIDGEGNIAAGTSTSGWSYKYPGRLGDSPVIGAGLYADNRYGACACTHTGEMTIRAATASSVVRYMKAGASVEDACNEACGDLGSLRHGYLGPVNIHAIDREGRFCVMRYGPADPPPAYSVWSEDMAAPDHRTGQIQ